jgi:hypothetical protein
MGNLELVITLAAEGKPRHAKCSVCNADIELARDDVPPKERKQKVHASFAEHVRTKHPQEDFSQAAARTVREATEK